MNDFKRHIKGWRKGGKTCPCCVELKNKKRTRRIARRRLKFSERREALREDREVSTEDDKMKE